MLIFIRLWTRRQDCNDARIIYQYEKFITFRFGNDIAYVFTVQMIFFINKYFYQLYWNKIMQFSRKFALYLYRKICHQIKMSTNGWDLAIAKHYFEIFLQFFSFSNHIK